MTIMLPQSPRRRYVLSAALVAWAAVWIAVGVATGLQVKKLTEVSDSLVRSGDALDIAGAALQEVGRLPLIGEASEQFGNEVRVTAEDIRAAGASSRETVRSVSVLLGAALVLIPIVPVVGFYVPLRISLARQRKAVGRALERIDQHPQLEAFLAHRAVQNLPYDTLREVSAAPWEDLVRGSYRHLANAELTRLGLAGPRRGRTAETRR